MYNGGKYHEGKKLSLDSSVGRLSREQHSLEDLVHDLVGTIYCHRSSGRYIILERELIICLVR